MNIEYSFFNEVSSDYDVYEKHFLNLAKRVFSHLKINEHLIYEVTLCDNLTIQKLNKEFRNIDRPTDVLSFEYGYKEEDHRNLDIPKYLGEIYISIPKAIEQAKDYNHSLNREISFLFVHGLLHLLGYDHQDEDEEKIMFKLQDEILDPLDL